MKLFCIIIDDEPMALNLIESYVLKTPSLELKGKFSNAIDILQFFYDTTVIIDIIFMDIQMPELAGLELSKKIPIMSQNYFHYSF